MMFCCFYVFVASFLLLLTKYYQDKVVKIYLKNKQYYYSSDVLKSQVKVFLNNYHYNAKFFLNAYFFMLLTVFVVTISMYLAHYHLGWYAQCHFRKAFIILLGLVVLFVGVQFYLEYYRFILPVAEEAIVYTDIRKKMDSPVSLNKAIDIAIETKSEELKILPLKKFLKIYDNYIFYNAGLKPLTKEDIEYFKNHSALAGFLINPNYNLYYMENERTIPGKDDKVYFLRNSKGIEVLIIGESKFQPFLNIVNNETKQQLVNIGDVFVTTLLLVLIFC